MEEAIKNRIILILSILTIIFFIGTVGSCKNVKLYRSGRQEEIAKRLDAEEKYSILAKEKATLDEKIKTIEKQAEEDNAALQATKKALVQEQLVNQSMKEELAKVTKLKEALEEDLKDALVRGGKSRSTKKQLN